MKTFRERCAEPIVTSLLRYKVAPRYIEGNMSDSVKTSRFGEGYDHTLEFQCSMSSEKLRPQTDLITNDDKGDMAEKYISEVTKELEKYPVVASNYAMESSGKALRMTKKEYESPDIELFRK